jgi:hypothetical protein
MEQMLYYIPCQILPRGQNQCSARKDRQFLANTNGTHTGGVGEATGVHPSLFPPRDGKLVGASKFLQWVKPMSRGHLDAVAGGAFLSLTINEAMTLIEKMVTNQG